MTDWHRLSLLRPADPKIVRSLLHERGRDPEIRWLCRQLLWEIADSEELAQRLGGYETLRAEIRHRFVRAPFDGVWGGTCNWCGASWTAAETESHRQADCPARAEDQVVAFLEGDV